MRKLAAILLIGVLGTTLAVAAGQRQGRVAGGGSVELAVSAKSAQAWAKQRPDYRDLRPGKTR